MSERTWELVVRWQGRDGEGVYGFANEGAVRSAASAYINGFGTGDAAGVRSVEVRPVDG